MDTGLIFPEAESALNAEKSMYQWKQQTLVFRKTSTGVRLEGFVSE